MRERTCCFSGHRDLPKADIPYIAQRTEAHILSLIRRGVLYFGVGGAVGYDTLAAQILFNLRDTICPQIKVILVYPFDGFTHFWTDAQRSLYAKLLPRYNKITQVSERNCPAAYLRRNRHLVDHSAYCICYCTRQTGGTAYTVQYARRMGLQILYTAPGMAQFS